MHAHCEKKQRCIKRKRPIPTALVHPALEATIRNKAQPPNLFSLHLFTIFALIQCFWHELNRTVNIALLPGMHFSQSKCLFYIQ